MASCHYCPAPATTRDHVIPKALGGPRATWNLVPACERCNQEKGCQTYESFTGKPLPLRARLRGFGTTEEFVAAWGGEGKMAELAAERRRRRRNERRRRRLTQRIGDHPAFAADLTQRPRGGW